VVATNPGDVIAFDLHLLHCSVGGARRVAWSVECLPWPGLRKPDRCEAVRALVADAVDVDAGRYDTSRWPPWRAWARGASAIASRAIAVQRLRILGVLTEDDLR